ncbi:MAG: antitoxin [Burkholderiales bacterium]|nr:AbrB/MazE/SpoVT family DNA-binding domain-containing protein [Burkholderiales bacterium]MDQ3196085.1 type II toxin-antitoxin system VapB family antitoxin [Pseudomonadota bacterium]
MKTAKLFQNGQSQAVRLPKEFRFEGDEVIITRVGNAVLLSPKSATYEEIIDIAKSFKGRIKREKTSVPERGWS